MEKERQWEQRCNKGDEEALKGDAEALKGDEEALKCNRCIERWRGSINS